MCTYADAIEKKGIKQINDLYSKLFDDGRIEDVKKALKEEMKKILDKVDNDLHLDTKPSLILVVGVNGVGKTTSSINLAASLGYLGKRVLLIDLEII